MAGHSLLWQLAYHLAGPTILGSTEPEPLGPLPLPLRTAVLQTVQVLDPESVHASLGRDTIADPVTERVQPYVWLRWWRYAEPALRAALAHVPNASPPPFASIDAFFQHYRIAAPEAGQDDEHYLERRFIEEAFFPVFGCEGLSYLEPQAPFQGRDDKQRRIDFVLKGEQPYAIETVGRWVHDPAFVSREKWNDDQARTRDLEDAGYRFRPYTFDDIESGRARTNLEQLAREDAALRRLLPGPETEAAGRPAPRLIPLIRLLRRLPDVYPLYQQAALAILWQAVAEGQSRVMIQDDQPVLGVLGLALLDTVALVERVAKLYGLPLQLPEVALQIVRPRDAACVTGLIECFRGSPLAEEDTRIDAPAKPVTIDVVDEPSAADYIFRDDTVATGRGQPQALQAFIAPFRLAAALAPPREARTHVAERRVLDYFGRRYFPIAALYDEQVYLIQRALEGKSFLGILPTAYGKSLIFQLYALLAPRTTLVISPLRALIRDQEAGLLGLGITAVAKITSDDTAAAKQMKLTEFLSGRYRLLYIAPERLLVKALYDGLRETLRRSPVGALVVDEAHCVSEWGHDFRPSYLHIGRLQHALAGGTDRPIPLIALTATASEAVSKDVAATLGLSWPDSVARMSSSDRPNLSLSVHPVPQPGQMPEKLARLLREEIPRALGMPFSEMIPLSQHPPYQHAGVVFAIYADVHGKHTLEGGVHYIQRETIPRAVADPALVHVHASTPPRCCPECLSPLSYREKRDGEVGYRCNDCKAWFAMPFIPNDWDTTIRHNQDAFKRNEFPVLVATKGYGMGIDKPNIRYIIHHGLASGFESYYQEAGRAGRDKEHAHVALVFIPPHPDCWQQQLQGTDDVVPEPLCVSVPNNYRYLECPFYEYYLCHYGHQARFIHGSYPGIDTDTDRTVKVFLEVQDAQRQGRAYISRRMRSASREADGADEETDERQTQVALYRLQQLGIIHGYSVLYRSRRKVEYHFEHNQRWSVTLIAERLKEFLVHAEVSPSKAEEHAQRVRDVAEEARKSGNPSSTSADSVVGEALRLLLERIYQYVLRMRYDMLRNEVEYAAIHPEADQPQPCRRVIVRSILDNAAHITPDNYRCGFCDVCQPNLTFRSSGAAVPVEDAQPDELPRRLADAYRQFNRDELTAIPRIAAGSDRLLGLLAQVTNYLEGAPVNLSALYLAGALARRRAGRARESLRYLAFGFEEGMRQGLPPQDLLLFYQEAAEVDPEEAFAWVSRHGGPWDTPDGLRFLTQEAGMRLRAGAPQVQGLRALSRIRTLQQTAARLAALEPAAGALAAQLHARDDGA